MEFITQHKRSIGGAVIGILFGFSIGAYWYNVSPTKGDDAALTATSTPQSSKGTDEVTLAVVDEGAFIAVSDQLAGKVVIINSLVIGTPGWVAIRETSPAGFGNILGARRVDAGAWSTLPVELLRGTESGMFYHAVLYKDDGDGEFDHKADSIIEKDGRTYSVGFMAQ
jgi:hypothetical protein